MSDSADYFGGDDAAHLLITGPTGRNGDFGGKSSLATWWCDNPGRTNDLVIFCNYKMDDVADVLDDFAEVESVKALGKAIGEGHRRLVLTPMHYDWELVSRRVEAFIRRLPADWSKLVVHDEVPELDEDAILSFVRVHGNGANCQSLCIAQSPTDVSTSIVKQCHIVWVGPMKEDYEAWFRTHDRGTHFQYISENHEPYHWSVLLGTDDADRDHYQPVPEVYGQI